MTAHWCCTIWKRCFASEPLNLLLYIFRYIDVIQFETYSIYSITIVLYDQTKILMGFFFVEEGFEPRFII